MKQFSPGKLAPFLILFISCAFILRLFVLSGVPLTHDGESHLARLANFYIALKDGHIPPRWAPNLNYKFGYPAFNFYYPLPYMISLPLYLFTGSFEIAYKISIFFALWVGACFLYLFLRKWVAQESALIGSILYVGSPPFLLQIFVRGAYGEIIAWSLFPVCLHFADEVYTRVAQKKTAILSAALLSFCICMLLLAHNMISLFVLAFLIFYLLVRYMGDGSYVNLKPLFASLSAFILGILLASYFLIPMVSETQYINAQHVAQSHYYYRHFLGLRQLFYSDWGYGNSVEGLADEMSFELGIIPLVIVGIGIGSVLHGLFVSKSIHIKRRTSFFVGFLVFASIVSIFLMLPVSSSMWKAIPYLKLVQYPWRLLVISSISISMLAAFLWGRITTKKTKYVLLLGIIVTVLAYARPQSLFHKSKYEYLEFPFTTSVNHELLTPQFNMYENLDLEDKLIDTEQKATFDIKKWKTQVHEYSYNAPQDTVVVEHLMYFPGWKSYVDNREILVHLELEAYPGIYAYLVPKGEHVVKTVFSEQTMARTLGNLLSLTAIGVLGVMVIYGVYEFKKNR